MQITGNPQAKSLERILTCSESERSFHFELAVLGEKAWLGKQDQPHIGRDDANRLTLSRRNARTSQKGQGSCVMLVWRQIDRARQRRRDGEQPLAVFDQRKKVSAINHIVFVAR
ncbi:MAG TPA: hypothetical protein VHQ64_00650 [Pyrinomonadaceae bacterium]|nr:hypothetical protein [Pyrinomonadaceae bacterium]